MEGGILIVLVFQSKDTSCAFISVRSLSCYSSPGVGHRQRRLKTLEILLQALTLLQRCMLCISKHRLLKASLFIQGLQNPQECLQGRGWGDTQGQRFRGQVESWAWSSWSHLMGCGHISQVVKGSRDAVIAKQPGAGCTSVLPGGFPSTAHYQDPAIILLLFPWRRNVKTWIHSRCVGGHNTDWVSLIHSLGTR
jgi:hypothetical protein